MACSCVGCLCVWPCVWWERSLCGLNGWLCAGSVWVFTHRASGVLYIYTLSIVGAPCCLCCVLRVCVCVCVCTTYLKQTTTRNHPEIQNGHAPPASLLIQTQALTLTLPRSAAAAASSIAGATRRLLTWTVSKTPASLAQTSTVSARVSHAVSISMRPRRLG